MKGPENRANLAPPTLSFAEQNQQLIQQYPDLSSHAFAVDLFAQRRIQRGAPITFGYKQELFLELMRLSYPFPRVKEMIRNTPWAKTVQGGAPREDVSECKEILKEMKEQREEENNLRQARIEVVNLLAQRPAILEDEAEIRAKIYGDASEKLSKKASTHVRKLSVVRRLRAQGHRSKEITLMSDIKSKKVVENFITILREHNLSQSVTTGRRISERTLLLGEIVRRERAKNLKISNAEIVEIATRELNEPEKPVTVRQVLQAINMYNKTSGGNRVRSIATRPEEQHALIDLFIEDSQQSHAGEEIDKNELAEFLGKNITWTVKLLRDHAKIKQNS